MATPPTAPPLATTLAEVAPAEFRSADFDLVSFVKAALDDPDHAARAAELDRAESQLGDAVGAHLASGYGELLGEVDVVLALEPKLMRCNDRVLALAQAVRRVRHACVGPHDEMRRRVAEQADILRCTHLLRRVQRLAYLCQRLRELKILAPSAAPSARAAPAAPSAALVSTELPKAAATLAEAEMILREDDLSGVDLVEAQLPFVSGAGRHARALASELLRTAMASSSQAGIGTALQAYFNLRELPKAARGAAIACAHAMRDEIRGAFGAEVPPSAGASAALRAEVWSRADVAAEAVHVAAGRVATLHRVLLKKRDALTHTVFATALCPAGSHAADAAARSNPADAPSVAAARAGSSRLDALLDTWTDADAAALLDAPADVVAMLTGSDTSAGPANLPTIADPPTADAPTGLAVLWAPLSAAIGAGLDGCHVDARRAVAAELPYILRAINESVERLRETLRPADLPAEAIAALSDGAILRASSAISADLAEVASAALDAASGAMLAQMRRAASGDVASRASSIGTPLGKCVVDELERAAATPQLQSALAAPCAAALRSIAATFGDLLREQTAGVPGAADANAALLEAALQLNAEISALLLRLPEAAAAPLRSALGDFAGPSAVLASPATPLPEAQREQATRMLKSMLRREMIGEA